MIAIVFICVAVVLAVLVVTYCWYTKNKTRKAQNINLTTVREGQEPENKSSGDGQENSRHVTEIYKDNYASLNVLSRGITNHQPGCRAARVYAKLHQTAPPCACHRAPSVNTTDDIEVLQIPLYQNTQPQRSKRIGTTSSDYHLYEEVM